MKDFIFPIVRASVLSDLACADGEVASASGIAHLLPDSDDVESDPSSPSGSGGSGSSPSAAKYLSPTGRELYISLPNRARLIAIHTPADDSFHPHYILLLPNGSISVQTSSSGGSHHIAFWPTDSLGELQRALCYGRRVVLAGETGIAWLLFDPDNSTYSFAKSLPSAPELTLEFEPATLPGYVSAAGRRPSLTLSIPLSAPAELSEASIGNWLEGISYAIPAANASEILAAVGEATARYVADVANAGLYLNPVCGVATYDGFLPSRPALSAEQTTPTMAVVSAWSWHAGILTLDIELTMLPMRLICRVNVADHEGINQLWRHEFSTVAVAINREPSRFASKSDIRPVAANRISDPSAPQERVIAFLFNSLNRSDIIAAATADTNFYPTLSFPLRNLSSASSIVGSSTPATASPIELNYADHSIFHPADIFATDEGVIYTGGTAEICDENGVFSTVAIEDCIVAGAKRGDGTSSPVMRYISRISDSRILAIAQGGSAKSAAATARHPLYAFCSDGIRILNPDGTGGYFNSRFIATAPISASGMTATTDSGICFITRSGLQFSPFSSKISTLLADPSLASAKRIAYIHHLNALAIIGADTVRFFDFTAERLSPEKEFPLRSFVSRDGELTYTSSDYTLMQLSAESISSADKIADSGEAASIEMAKTSDFIEDKQGEGGAYFVTRPIKLGNVFTRKRIREIEVSASGCQIYLDGSDDLNTWQLLAMGSSPLRSLRLPARRFYRLTVHAPATEADRLRFIHITTR